MKLIGYYSPFQYSIWTIDDKGSEEEIYRAGNSSWESQVYLPVCRGEEQEDMAEMKKFCEQTIEEERLERGLPVEAVLGVQEEEGWQEDITEVMKMDGGF
jgi:hypothetical protein